MSSTTLPVCPKTGSTSPSLTVHLCLHTAPGNRECAREEPLKPPSKDKLEKNRLSPDAAGLLRLGRRKEALVEAWFRKNRRPDLGERIAEAFRRRYAQLNDGNTPADDVFEHLQQYAGMGGKPARQAAVLAVLSYFFERCDIFDDPEEENDPADQAHSA